METSTCTRVFSTVALMTLWSTSAGLAAAPAGVQDGAAASGATCLIERVSTAVPFPRGLALVDGKLYTVCRGRVRDAGGVSAEIEDQAGTLYAVDPGIAEPINAVEVGTAVRENAQLVALPSAPPFIPWDRASDPPESDRLTDRPYCTLRYHEGTKSFYVCAFSGIDKPAGRGRAFSKNLTDALLRYDLRTGQWHEVERHDIQAGGSYPHADPGVAKPPLGWLNGPDNCLAVGNQLYAVAKENNVLVRYDLTDLTTDPHAGAPPSALVLDEMVKLRGADSPQPFFGPSALAARDGYLYVGYRTSSVILRFPIDSDGMPVQPIEAELVARFRPYDPATGRSAELTDMDFDATGRLHVVCAKPAAVHRFTPDPRRVYDATADGAVPWLDLAGRTGNARMKCENILVDGTGCIFVTSGDGHDFQHGAHGTIYRITCP